MLYGGHYHSVRRPDLIASRVQIGLRKVAEADGVMSKQKLRLSRGMIER